MWIGFDDLRTGLFYADSCFYKNASTSNTFLYVSVKQMSFYLRPTQAQI